MGSKITLNGIAALTAMFFMLSSGSGMAFMAASPQLLPSSKASLISFRGETFPYRYNWSIRRACTRYEPVETARGTILRRTWVCSVPRP